MPPLSRALLLALLFCAPSHAQTRTGTVSPVPSATGEGIGVAPAAQLSPAAAPQTAALQLGPGLPGVAPAPTVAPKPAGAAAARIASIDRLRALAGEPPLAPAARAALEKAPAAELVRAQAAAAKTLIAKTNPSFDARITAESRLSDPPSIHEYKLGLAEARVILENVRRAGLSVEAVREGLSTDGDIDADKVARAYDGGALLQGMPKALSGDPTLSALVRDGAADYALARLSQLQTSDPSLRSAAGKAAVERLRERLGRARPNPEIGKTREALDVAESFLKRREFGLALEAARRTLESAKIAQLTDTTRRLLSLEAYEIIDKTKDRAGSWVYGAKGEHTAAELLAHVRELQRSDPDAYVGDPLSGEPTRVQKHGDCAVQQAYNHPRMAALAVQLPYPSFLSAVEAANGTRVRKEGLASHESRFLFHRLGLSLTRQKAPADAEGLAALLREHGALTVTVAWHATEALRGGDHAVLLQGAFRERGQWRFILIDSNSRRPQLYSFMDFQLLSPGDYSSVEPLPADSPYLSKELRAIADPERRLRAAAHDFIQRFAVRRPFVPWWKRVGFGALNALRARLGLEELEPAPSYELDPNAIPLDQLSRDLQAAVRAGGKLPPEALLNGPDGKTYLNAFLVEKLLP